MNTPRTVESLEVQYQEWIDKKKIKRLIEAMWLFIQAEVPGNILTLWLDSKIKEKI